MIQSFAYALTVTQDFTIYSLSILSVVDATAAVHVNKLGFVYQDDANYNLCHWKREDGCLITTSDAV